MSPDADPDAVPVEDRGWPSDAGCGREIAAEAATAVARAHEAVAGKLVHIGSQAIDALARWPESWARWACDELAADIAVGRPIRNPGVLLCAVARNGALRYFPAEDPDAHKARKRSEKAAAFVEWIAAVDSGDVLVSVTIHQGMWWGTVETATAVLLRLANGATVMLGPGYQYVWWLRFDALAPAELEATVGGQFDE